MKRGSKYSLVVVFLLLQFFGLSQNEAKKWYFGYGTGLDFSTTPPSTISVSSMSTQEGCASIADGNGNLLFYTNGVTIWDRTHGVMANGTGLLGSTLSSQSSLIIQQPGSAVIYYVFTNVGFNIPNVPNVNYSIVDMSLATGNGSVVTKNAILSSDQNTEVLTATRHCNGTDWWIVTHIRSSNVFVSFLLTSTGISPGFVPSPQGPALSSGFSQLKISPNGQRIALSYNGAVYIGNFDASNGQVSGLVQIQNSVSGYGCEFSPDNSKLYAGAQNGIIQYNMCNFTPTSVPIGVVVYNSPGSYGSMQLAPNGKIYLSFNSFTTSCHVINTPNATGGACGYQAGSNVFLPKQIHAGLPNFPGCLFYQPPNLNPYFFQVSTGYGCYGAYFDAQLFATNCAAISNSLAMMVWDFDDPLSGPNNISYTTTPIHHFSGNGTYYVKLILHYTCAFPSDTITQAVVINDNCLGYSSTSITCASLGSATISSAVGTGPFTYTWLPQNQTGVVVNSLTPGGHTVVVYDVGANYTYSVPINLPSLSPYTANIAPTASVTCYGGNNGAGAISGVSGGSGQQSYAWINGTVGIAAQNPTNLFAGTWSVTVTDNLTSCTVNSLITIQQPPAITLTPSSSSASICVGHSLALNVTAAGGVPPPLNAYTYTWVNGPTSASNVITETISGVYVYSVTGKDANNCLANSNISISVVANPTISVSNVSICPLAFGVLTASGASSYTWYTAATSSVSNNFADNPAATTQYTVIGSAFSCSTAATASIILHAVPNASIQTSTPLCLGGTMSITATGGASYQWTGPSLFASTLASNTLNNLSSLQAGVYNVTVTSANGCTSTAVNTVVVNTPPAITAVGSTVCTSQTISLNANSSAGASYYWMGPQGFSSSSQNAFIANPSIAKAGSYTVIVTAVDGCTNTTNVAVSVVNPPSLLSVLNSNSICAQALNNSVNTLTMALSGANTYTLLAPPGINTVQVPAGFALSTQTPFATSLTAVTVTLEGSNGICSSVLTRSFTLVPNPVITVFSSSPAICAGQNFTLTTAGASNYTWLPNGFNYSINGSGSTIVTQPSVTAVYNVYGTANGCKSATQPATVNVFALPTITLSSRSTSICLNSATTFSVKGTGTAYQWLPGNGLNTTTGTLVTCSTLSNQVYTVVASVNNCTSAITSSVHVWPLPTPGITSASKQVCLGDTITLVANGASLYEWKGPDNTTVFGQRVKILAVSLNMAGNYTVTATDSNACRNTTITAVQILSLPSGEIANFTEAACIPYCLPIKFIADKNRQVQSSWKINGKSIGNAPSTYCFADAGTYTLSGKIIEDTTGCTSNVQFYFNAYTKPNADFGFYPTTPLELLDEVKFTADAKTNAGLRYQWYVDDETRYLGSSAAVSHVFEQAGDYRVALVVKNAYACADTVVKTIHVDEDFDLYIPNTFTPNDDGLNDSFKASVRSVKQFQMKVYDRWGTEVFYCKSADEGWDGRFKDEPCKQDTYTWTIELSTKAGQHVMRTGTVLLLRSR